MRISCPSCQSSYKIADEKVQGRTVKVRCRKCGLTIHVNEQGVMNEAAAAASSAETGAGGDAQFSVLVAEGDQRDMGLADIVAAYNSGVITGDTFVWSEGQPDWMPLGEVQAIIDAISAASEAVDKAATGQPAADAPPMVTATPAPVATATPAPVVAAPAPVVPAREPAAPAPAPAPAPSLFGAAPPPAAAAPAPLFGPGPTAAVQTSHEKKPDLFSTQAMAGSDDDVATSAPRVSPTVANKPTGARDESSVLFSLSALTSAAAATSSSSSADTNTGGDDSGLIDLRALAEKDAGAPQPALAAPVGGILDAAPLLGTPIMDPNLHQLKASDPPPAKSNTPLIIGIAIGAVGILSAVVAVVVVLTREPPPPAPLPVATTTEVAPTIPVPMPTDTSSSAAAAPPTGAPSATAPTARPTGPRTSPGKTGGTTGAATTKPASTGGATEPAPTKKPPANKCNCPPGDLACNMACAVK